MTYLQGRLFAANEAQAVDKLYALLQAQGYEAAGPPWLRAANVQFCDEMWVEYRVAVERRLPL